MIAHIIPQFLAGLRSGGGRSMGERWCVSGLALEGRDGPVRVPLHAASRCQGSRIGAGAVPGGAGARRLRRSVLLSSPRSARARCRRQRAPGGNRGADCRLHAVFGPARAVLAGALWHQRDAEDRRRGPRGADRTLKAHAGITDAVSFVGLGHKFRIWEPDRFRAELAEATEKVRAFKQELGARLAAARTPPGAREE